MPRTPDSRDGPLYEEEVRFEEQTSDPTENLATRYVQDKGLVIFEDGVARAVGESREVVWQKTVIDKDLTAPPGGESAGDRYIVGSSATGAWAGHDGEIAQWTGTAWVFTTPKHGTVVYVQDEDEAYKQTASSSPWSWGIAASGVTEAQHKALRHLIHFIDNGPADGFSTAPYKEPKSGTGPWDHGYTWWESSSKSKKIIEKTINRNTNRTPSTIVWVIYDTDGSTPLVTATDTYAYTGGAVQYDSVTRTFS